MMKKHQFLPLFFSIISLFSHSIFATPYYGITVSNILIANEPEALRGYQIMFDYDPELFKWRKFNIYFDAGFSHFSETHSTHAPILNIYSAAPVVRYTFRQRGPIHPYIELSIGLSYLNQTHMEKRNLGMHFAFQDRMGIGFFVGDKRQLSIGVHAMHYSNAHLCSHNSGISMPLVLDVSYRFQ